MLVPKLRDTLRLEEVGEEEVGSKTTWQLRQNSGASVIRYLKMIGKSCLGGRKLNVRFTLWSKMKDKLDF